MLTDEQLIEQLKSGYTEALDELYTRYSRELYVFCNNITHSQDSVDLVQDVFIRIIEAADRFNPKKASFRTWIFRIARNHCIDFLRRQDTASSVVSAGNLSGDEYQNMQDIEENVVRSSIMEAVHECINRLENEQEKMAIMLYYIGEKVYREIGDIIGKSTSMAKNRVTSAQEKVKRCLERKGIISAT